MKRDQYNQLEYDVGAWLLNNKDSLYEKIVERHNPAYHLFPGDLFEIYLENYERSVLSILKEEVGNHFDLNPEEIALIINRDYVIMLLNKTFLVPPRAHEEAYE